MRRGGTVALQDGRLVPAGCGRACCTRVAQRTATRSPSTSPCTGVLVHPRLFFACCRWGSFDASRALGDITSKGKAWENRSRWGWGCSSRRHTSAGGNERTTLYKFASCWLAPSDAVFPVSAAQNACLLYQVPAAEPCRVRLVLAAYPPTCEPTFAKRHPLVRPIFAAVSSAVSQSVTAAVLLIRTSLEARRAYTPPTTATSQRAAGSPAWSCAQCHCHRRCLGSWTTRSGSPLFTTWCLP